MNRYNSFNLVMLNFVMCQTHYLVNIEAIIWVCYTVWHILISMSAKKCV